MINPLTKAYDYATGVESGEIIVGELIKDAVKRFRDDLLNAETKGFYFDEEEAQKGLDFFEMLCFTKGKWKGRPFSLEPWQCFIVANIYGWIRLDDGNRRFTEVYIEIPKKNGKTELAAGVGLLMLVLDDENTPEVYAAAATRDQANICFKAAKSMARQSEFIRHDLSINAHNLYCDYNEGTMLAVSHDADNTEGKHSSCVLFDEYHVHKTDDVKTSLRSGMAAREQPLFFTITTSGSNKQGPCYKYRGGCIDVLKRVYDRDNLFTMIYTLDEGDNWEDPAMWRKANPNYGVSVRPQFLQEEYEKAKKNGREEVEFKTKHLNLWVDADVTWIPKENWVACEDTEFIPPRGAVCFGGIDLGNSSDISSFSLYFPEFHYLKSYNYVAKEAAEYAAKGGISYQDWIDEGHLHATEGKTTDYEFIKNDIFECAQMWDIRFIGMDPNHGQLFFDQVSEGLGVSWGARKNLQNGEVKWANHAKLEKFSQAVAAFNSPTRMFEEMVTNGILRHDGNPVTTWMLGNVALVTNHLGQIKPAKDKSKDKIDGIIAAIMAVGEHSLWHVVADTYEIDENYGIY
ncbi:terminase large subunit [Dyadobacter sp. CY312]|uniref:terminase large subunit n=1 Tax=Dyadobacter sp. CY312 TaxID=2907303 RepID=UPI001F184604|nr:terminase TerL endonuclease subunit [Dyadobacter sp. CY312]MCE7038983.1 terminase large subunit [Dyadobacter sp. CY312]